MSQVFISYSRKDIAFVRRLDADLRAAGLQVWWDLSGIQGGEEWELKISAALESSACVIVVLSPDSVKSPWVRREYLAADQGGRKILPLLYRPCAIPLTLKDRQAIDVQGARYAENLGAILSALGIPAPRAGEARGTPPPAPAQSGPATARLNRTAAGIIAPGKRNGAPKDAYSSQALALNLGGEITEAGLYVLADSFGLEKSDLQPANLAVEAVQEHFRGFEIIPYPVDVRQELLAALGKAHEQLAARYPENGASCVVAFQADGEFQIANIGDTRAYLFRRPDLRRVTTDHSLVQRLVETGQIEPEEARTHPQRNVVYRCLGGQTENLNPDTFTVAARTGDILLLCSDGLWASVEDKGIAQILSFSPDPEAARDRLVQAARFAGAEEDISLVLVRVD